ELERLLELADEDVVEVVGDAPEKEQTDDEYQRQNALADGRDTSRLAGGGSASRALHRSALQLLRDPGRCAAQLTDAPGQLAARTATLRKRHGQRRNGGALEQNRCRDIGHPGHHLARDTRVAAGENAAQCAVKALALVSHLPAPQRFQPTDTDVLGL